MMSTTNISQMITCWLYREVGHGIPPNAPVMGRLGYAWMQNAYDEQYKASGDPAIAWSNSIFRMEGDTHWITCGMGYRFSRNLYLDAALVYKTQVDDLYPFPNLYTEGRKELVIDASPFELKNSSLRGLLTLGYRF